MEPSGICGLLHIMAHSCNGVGADARLNASMAHGSTARLLHGVAIMVAVCAWWSGIGEYGIAELAAYGIACVSDGVGGYGW